MDTTCICGHGIGDHRLQRDECIVLRDSTNVVGCGCSMFRQAPQKCADKTHDSGQRTTFNTGSQRDIQENKGRFDLISPWALIRLARVLERGAKKYEARNWEKGQPFSQYINSTTRHIVQFLAGDRSEDHLGQAMWNLHALVHTEELVARGLLPRELNDMPAPTKKPEHEW